MQPKSQVVHSSRGVPLVQVNETIVNGKPALRFELLSRDLSPDEGIELAAALLAAASVLCPAKLQQAARDLKPKEAA